MANQSSTSTSSTTQQELSKLQEQMHKGAADASSYLDTLKTRLTEYDNSHKLSETATSYFQAGMDRATSAVSGLQKASEDVRTKGNDASEAVVNSAKSSLEQAQKALADLTKSAQAYDEKTRESINTSVANAKEGSSKTLTSWQDSLTSLFNSTRETTFSGFEALQKQIAATQEAFKQQATTAQTKVSEAAGEVAKQASEAAEKASEASKPADKSQEAAAPSLLERASDMITSSVGYVASTIQNATASTPAKDDSKKSTDASSTTTKAS